MRTYKLNVTELDKHESIVIEFGNNRVEIQAISDGELQYLEVRVPSGHTLSNMVQRPFLPNEAEVFFTNPEWVDEHMKLGDGLQEISGPIRFITFVNS